MQTETPDFIAFNQGSIVMLAPMSDDAAAWAASNIAAGDEPNDGSPYLGALTINHRCFMDIAIGLLRDGLTMQDAATGRMAHLPESQP